MEVRRWILLIFQPVPSAILFTRETSRHSRYVHHSIPRIVGSSRLNFALRDIGGLRLRWIRMDVVIAWRNGEPANRSLTETKLGNGALAARGF